MKRLLPAMQSGPEHTTAIYVARENVARFRKLVSDSSNIADKTGLLAQLMEEEARLAALTALQKVFQPASTEVDEGSPHDLA